MNRSKLSGNVPVKNSSPVTSEFWWIPDDGEVWTLASQVSDELPNGCVNFLIQKSQKIVTLPLEKCLPAPSSQISIPEDLVYIPEVNSASILSCIRSRFIERKIYTNIGMVLMSVNPFDNIPGLYGKAMIDKYENPMSSSLPAHVYIIASRAFHNLCQGNGHNQSILISGESGAGKTEATKHCLSFLAELANRGLSKQHNNHSTVGITDRILFASPILEAFGNAKTLRNNNSSRFGKWMVLHFDQHNLLHSSNIISYLLEKSRVTQRDPKERNYHIFYQLLRGLDPSILSSWNMVSDTRQYRFLQAEDGFEAIDLEDRRSYQETFRAFLKVGFSEEETLQYLRLVAAVLQLGNVVFSAIRDGEACDIKTPQFVDHAATLLGVNPQILSSAMTSRTIESGKGRKSVISIHLNSQKAQETRDTLARSLYDKLFHDIIDVINAKAMTTPSAPTHSSPAVAPRKFIGLLDIFGFEIFQENSFEQLCINYCNEMLQFHFNWIVFTAEKHLYATEGIYCETIEFRDNSETIREIEQVFKALDEEARIPKGSSKTWFDKLKRNLKSSPSLSFPTRRSGDIFVVKHYAGEVDYSPVEFMDKNIEVLNNDLLNAMVSSRDSLVFRLYTKTVDSTAGGVSSPVSTNNTSNTTTVVPTSSAAAATTAGRASSTSSLTNKSISWRFIHQLNSLMAMLRETQSHFIRCIKSNDSSLAQRFDSVVVYKQLTYSGIFEVVKIQQSGLPCRLTHSDFVARFRCLAPSKLRFTIFSSKELLKCLQGIGFDLARAKTGTNLVFFSSTEQRLLESRREQLLDQSSVRITRCFRMITRRFAYRVIIHYFRQFQQFNAQLDAEPATAAYQQFSLSCQRLDRLVGYPVLDHQISLMKKHLDFLDARVDLIKEAQEKLSQQTVEAVLSLDDIIARAIDLEITNHSVIQSCKSVLQKYHRTLEFMEIVELSNKATNGESLEEEDEEDDNEGLSDSELETDFQEKEKEKEKKNNKGRKGRRMTLNHLTKTQLEECISSLEQFKDLIPTADTALQFTLQHQQKVERELLETFQSLEVNFALAETVYDETSGDLTLRNGDEGAEAYLALQRLVQQLEGQTFYGKDCAVLYEDCSCFIRLMEEYVASNDAFEAKQFLRSSSLGKTDNPLFVKQLPEIQRWMDVQMIPHRLRDEALRNHMIPKSDRDEEVSQVSGSELEEILQTLQQLSAPSEGLFVAMKVTEHFLEIRRAFQESDWKRLEERIELASEENIHLHLFDDYPSCFDELHHASWQITYHTFRSDLLYSISEPIIQSISFEMESWIVLVSDLQEDLSLMQDIKTFADSLSSSKLLSLIPLFEAILQLRSLLYSGEIAFSQRVMASIQMEHSEVLKQWNLEEKIQEEFSHCHKLLRKLDLEDQLHHLLVGISFEVSVQGGEVTLLTKEELLTSLRTILTAFRDLSPVYTPLLSTKLRFCELLETGLDSIVLKPSNPSSDHWKEMSRSFEGKLSELLQSISSSLSETVLTAITGISNGSNARILPFDPTANPQTSEYFLLVWQKSRHPDREGEVTPTTPSSSDLPEIEARDFFLLLMTFQVVMYEMFRRYLSSSLKQLLAVTGVLVGSVNVDLSIDRGLLAQSVLQFNEVCDLVSKNYSFSETSHESTTTTDNSEEVSSNYRGFSQTQTLTLPQYLLIRVPDYLQRVIKVVHRQLSLRQLVLNDAWEESSPSFSSSSSSSTSFTVNPRILSLVLEIRYHLRQLTVTGGAEAAFPTSVFRQELEKIAWECQSRVVIQSLRRELEHIPIENIAAPSSTSAPMRKIFINLTRLKTVIKQLEEFPAVASTQNPAKNKAISRSGVTSKQLLQLSHQLIRLLDFLSSNQIDKIHQTDIDKVVQQFEDLQLNTSQIHRIFHQIQIHNFLHELNENLLLFRNHHHNLHLLLKSIHQLHRNLLKIIQSQQNPPSLPADTTTGETNKPPAASLNYHHHLWKCLLWLKASYFYCDLSAILSNNPPATSWIQIIEGCNQLDEFLQIYLMPLFYEIIKPRIRFQIQHQRRASRLSISASSITALPPLPPPPPPSSDSSTAAVLDYTEDVIRFMELCIQLTKEGFQLALTLKSQLDEKQKQSSLLALSPIDNLKKDLRDADFHSNPYSIGHLKRAGFSNRQIVETLAFDAKLLWAYDVDLHLIKRYAASRYTCRELLSGGYSLKELYNCGFSPKDIYGSGLASIADLMSIGLSVSQLRESGLSEEVILREVTAALQDPHQSQHPPHQLLAAIKELKGFNLSKLLLMGYHLQDLSYFDFSLLELRGAGFSAQEILNYFQQRSLLLPSAAAPTLSDFTKAGFPLKSLVAVFPLQAFRHQGFTFEEMRRLGVDNDDELYDAGYVEELEYEALSLLYQATHGSFWRIKTNWNNYEVPLSQWFGVQTSLDSQSGLQRVTSLDLVNNNLRGFLPVELCNLKKLKKLRLSLNNLSNEIPPKLLQVLLQNEVLTDFIKLNQSIVPPVPPSAATAPSLPFSPSSHPESITRRSLAVTPSSHPTSTVIDPSQSLTSPLRDSTTTAANEVILRQRRFLKEFYHSLNGKRWKRRDYWCSEEPLESWFGLKVDQRGEVVAISLPSNNLQGIIPLSINCLRGLRTLDLRLNQIHGFIPATLGQCLSLEKIFLQSNKLCGVIPDSLKDLTSLEVLDVRSNLLTGLLSHVFLSMGKLRYLGIHSNNFNDEEVHEVVLYLKRQSCKVVK